MAPPRNIEGSAQRLCEAAGCADPDLVVQAALAAWVLSLAVLTLVAVVRIGEARRAVGTERERTRDERDAFERFARRVANRDPGPLPADAGGSTLHGDGGVESAPGVVSELAGPPPDDGGLAAVREAYRETVMDVPHYESDYGESLEEHLRAEFGPDLARTVADGGALSPQLQRALVAGARDNYETRDELLSALDDELAALSEAEHRLEAVEREADALVERPLLRASYDDLDAAWRRLDGLEAECEAVLAEREATIRDDDTTGPQSRNRHLFHDYLYGDLDGRYPVLASAAELIESLEALRSDVLQSLARRV